MDRSAIAKSTGLVTQAQAPQGLATNPKELNERLKAAIAHLEQVYKQEDDRIYSSPIARLITSFAS